LKGLTHGLKDSFVAFVSANMALVDEIAKEIKKELRNHIQKEKKK